MKETKFKQTEVGMIPRDWEVACLGDLGSFKNGISKPAEKFGHGFPFVNLMDIFEKTSIKGNEEFGLIESVSSEQQMYSLRRGDVLFVRSSVKPEGVGLTTVVKKDLSKTVFSGFILRFRELGERLNTDYKEFVFYSDYFRRNLIASSTVSANTNINQPALKKLIIAFPKSIEEQQRIANALSDVDTLINNLEKLIAKKKNIKQGAMQQLLTGKKRLPGFAPAKPTYKQTELGKIPADWEVKNIGKLLKIGHGRDYKNLKSGNVPVYGTGGYMTSVNDYLYEGETVCIGRKGTIDKPFYHTGKIWTVDTLFYTYGFNGCIPKFIYYAFCLVDWLAMNEASGVPSLTSKNIEDVLLRIPPSKAEQTAIANVLSDMDTEISALETKLAKYRTLKTGMMQQLLTGKIRLV